MADLAHFILGKRLGFGWRDGNEPTTTSASEFHYFAEAKRTRYKHPHRLFQS